MCIVLVIQQHGSEFVVHGYNLPGVDSLLKGDLVFRSLSGHSLMNVGHKENSICGYIEIGQLKDTVARYWPTLNQIDATNRIHL